MKTYRERSIVITTVGSVVALVGVVILGFALSGSAGVLQLVVGFALFVLGSLIASMYGEVSIGTSEVDIRLVPVPRRTIAIADIKSVEPIDIAPMQFGGWGWRRRAQRTTALILRGGPGARIRLTDGSQFVVSGRLGKALLTELR